MKFRRNKKDFFEFENDRKTHVKLYKAGKQWVSSLISSIGLIRVFKGKLDKSTINTQLVSKEKDKKSEDKLSSDGITAALKGAAALGAVAGGTVLTANTALADTKQLDSNQNLVNKDTVNLSSGSGSSSTSDSLSTSESNTQSTASVSKSESVSLDTNSSSTSETHSDSNSKSESISESKSDSNSQSVSSQTTSKSESLASTSLENSQTTTGTTAKDKLQGLINQATDFVNSDAFKSSSSDLKTALAATVKQYANVMQSSTSLTEQDYQYGIDGLTLLMNEIKSPSSSIKPNVFMTSASTSSNSTYNPVSAASDDIGSVYNTTNGLRWIYGDNKVWGRMQDVFTSRDTGQSLWMAKANFKITKTPSVDVKGKDHWTITFFPNKGLMYDPSSNPDPYGLYNARFGFLLTKDYTITSNVNIQVNVDLNHPFFGNGLTGNKTQVDSTNNQASFDFDPSPNKDDVNKTDGHVNNRNFIGDKGSNGYIQETYYISNNVNGSQTSNLLQNRIYQGNSYDTLETEDQTARQKSRILTKDGNVVGKNGVISKDAFGTAMYMKSYGTSDESMHASYTISFDTMHSNKVQKDLPLGTNGGAFSGVYASVDTYQRKGIFNWRNLLGDFYGEESMKNDSTTNNNLPRFESDSKARSESDSQSKLQSQLQSQNESKSVSTAQSESTSTSSSLSESLSKSSSLSESTSTSSSLSESLSTSSSFSESLSTSSSLSESLSTSSSLSESLSTSSSLSERLSTSSSLSESLSTSSSLSES
ncbi:accessory Sec-dependent serine-rich glycoprotein adhesin, partial [Ligilactobacillus salivarius]